MSGWLMERYGTEGYVVSRMGHPAEVTILPGNYIDAEDWGEDAVGLDITIKRTAERIRDALNAAAAPATPTTAAQSKRGTR